MDEEREAYTSDSLIDADLTMPFYIIANNLDEIYYAHSLTTPSKHLRIAAAMPKQSHPLSHTHTSSVHRVQH